MSLPSVYVISSRSSSSSRRRRRKRKKKKRERKRKEKRGKEGEKRIDLGTETRAWLCLDIRESIRGKKNPTTEKQHLDSEGKPNI